MDTYNLDHDVPVFGRQVKSFPTGVKEAFTGLMNSIPDGAERTYYGISYMDANGKIIYQAAVEERQPGEAASYKCESYTIEKGTYLMETIKNWMSQTDCIKDAFHELMEDSRADKTKPVVEWYKTDEEMACLVRTHS